LQHVRLQGVGKKLTAVNSAGLTERENGATRNESERESWRETSANAGHVTLLHFLAARLCVCVCVWALDKLATKLLIKTESKNPLRCVRAREKHVPAQLTEVL